MGRAHRSVRVDAQLLAELEQLARDKLVPATFSEQVDVGLRMLAQHGAAQRLARSAAVVAADQHRAHHTYRQLHPGSQR